MTTFRHLFLLLVLASGLTAQSYHVTFDDHTATVDDGSFAKLVEGDSWAGDVTTHDGEVVVMNGALENYVGTLSGQLTISETETGSVLFSEDVIIHDGCGFVWHEDPLGWSPPDQRAADFLDVYYAGGLYPEGYPEGVLNFELAGPNPDYEDPGQTGSGRVAWNRYAAGDIVRLRHELSMPVPEHMWEELTRWGLTDWDRSQNYYSADNGYLPWTKSDYPESVLGAYRSDKTFNTNYGNTELFGRPGDDAPGNWPSDFMHCDNAKATVLYAITGSWAAERASANECHNIGGQLKSSGWHVPEQRAIGWPLRCWTLHYAATGDEGVIPYMVTALGLIEYAQEVNPGYSFLQRYEYPKVSSGGYIYADPWFVVAVEEYNSLHGTQLDPFDLSSSASAWQESILGISLVLSQQMAPVELRSRFQKAAIRCAQTVFVTMGMPSFVDHDLIEFAATGMEDPGLLGSSMPDNGAGVPIFQSRSIGGRALQVSGNWITGVGSGTVVPFGDSFLRVNGAGAGTIIPVVDSIVEQLYLQNYWVGNTPDKFLMDRGREWMRRQGGWKVKGWNQK